MSDPRCLTSICLFSTAVDVLIRCQTDASQVWSLVCDQCWPGVSGGVTDGDLAHPHYRYGGLWRNRHVRQGLRAAVNSAVDTPSDGDAQDLALAL